MSNGLSAAKCAPISSARPGTRSKTPPPTPIRRPGTGSCRRTESINRRSRGASDPAAAKLTRNAGRRRATSAKRSSDSTPPPRKRTSKPSASASPAKISAASSSLGARPLVTTTIRQRAGCFASPHSSRCTSWASSTTAPCSCTAAIWSCLDSRSISAQAGHARCSSASRESCPAAMNSRRRSRHPTRSPPMRCSTKRSSVTAHGPPAVGLDR